MPRSSPSSLRTFAVLLGVATVAGGWLAVRGDGFDADAWRREAGNHSGPNARADMAAALGARLPPGTPRTTVRTLLGDSDFLDDRQDVYSLGRSTMGPHFESQAIYYDTAGRVAAMRRRRMWTAHPRPASISTAGHNGVNNMEGELTMVDLRHEADRHADMIRPHVEQTGGVEPFFIANRTGHPPLAVPATFETVEAKEEGLELLRAMFQELGCTHVAWISEAWVAVSPHGPSGPAPRDRPDRTEALMIVVEDAAGAQAVRIDPFTKSEGGIRWGEPFQDMQAERRLLSGPVDPTLLARARAMAERYRPEGPGHTTAVATSFLRRMIARVSGRG